MAGIYFFKRVLVLFVLVALTFACIEENPSADNQQPAVEEAPVEQAEETPAEQVEEAPAEQAEGTSAEQAEEAPAEQAEGTPAEQAEEAPAEQAEVQMEDIQNTESDFKIDIWVNREDKTYKIGDEINFMFKTNKDCRLTLFNIGTTGKVHIIFPNGHFKDNAVKAGETYQIPSPDSKFIFTADGPAGTETVKAIATLEEVVLVSEADKTPAGDFQAVNKDEAAVAKDIGIALRPVPEKNWAEAQAEIKIVE